MNVQEPLLDNFKEVHEFGLGCATGRAVRVYTDLAAVRFGRPSFPILPWVPEEKPGPLLSTFVKDHPAIERVDSLDQADMAVLPFDAACLIDQPYGPANVEAIAYARSFREAARKAGVRVVAVAAGDSSKPFPVEFDVVLRHSIDRGKKLRGEYCVPGWFDAAQDASDNFRITPSPRGPKPRLGFCGQAAPRDAKLTLRRLRQAWWRVRHGTTVGGDEIDALLLRRRVIDSLAGASAFETNFVIRDRFFASLADKSTARDEFVENIERSDYVLCVRGSGNYSFRFFDACAHGRVPVVIDTDCAFPNDHLIDFKKLVPIVPLSEIDRVESVIAEHYRKFTDEAWLRLQNDLRTFYIEWLSPVGFFKKLLLIPELQSWVENKK